MLETAALLLLLNLPAVTGDLSRPYGQAPVTFDHFQPGDTLAALKVENVYENGSGKAVGARFVAQHSGFIIDLFQIESVPQAFFWVKTPVYDNRGEPHTCEHLLLGKGNVGRNVSALEEMTLGTSTAYTDQMVTCYHYNTVAGPEAFFTQFQARLNALLNPDFTNEEIRREVCHVGVVNTADGKLWVDEKGTVYNEMVSNYEKPWSYLSDKMDEMVFGPDHPAANISGGRPDAIRQMVPQNLRDFHSAAYHLANMGAIVSIPASMNLKECLARLSASLNQCQSRPDSSAYEGIRVKGLPDPTPSAPVGTIVINDYPSENVADPGEMLFSWPAELDFGIEDEVMLNLFLGVMANGSSSLLYDDFFNSQTKKLELGAGNVYGSSSRFPGRPVRIGLGGLNCAKIDTATIRQVRRIIEDEIKTVLSYGDGSPQLAHFNHHAAALLAQTRRSYQQILETPPQFGDRGGPAGQWLSLLEGLEYQSGFRKSLVLKDVLDRADSLVNTDKNIWRDGIARWKLTESEPYSVAIKPSPALLEKMGKDKDARLAGYVDGYEKRYSVADPQKALKRYKAEFDSVTATLDALQSKTPMPRFVDNPPMSLDPDLVHADTLLSQQSGFFRIYFDNMQSATFGIMLDPSRHLPDSLLIYVPLLPAILTQIGVTFNDTIIPYDEMETRLRSEIRELTAYYNHAEESSESRLILRVSGNNIQETARAIQWMQAGLFHPLLTKDNLPRIRDVVAQSLVASRNVMKGGEESWVDAPYDAYRFQNDPFYMAENCFLTQEHFLQRLKWLLTDPGDIQSQSELKAYISSLKKLNKKSLRADIQRALHDDADLPKSESAKAIALSLREDLTSILTNLPDNSLAKDWSYLLNRAEIDLLTPPGNTLAQMKQTLEALTERHETQLFFVGSHSSEDFLKQNIANFYGELKPRPLVVVDQPKQGTASKASNQHRRYVDERLKERNPKADPYYVGLIDPDTRNGVLQFSYRMFQPSEASSDWREYALNCLSGKLFAGGGAHGFFMQTWGAGLAYSNGINFRDLAGTTRYYAERCPDVSETMRFVTGILKKAHPDTSLTDYAVAQAFSRSNAADTYEARGEEWAMGALAGPRPDDVEQFRKEVLKLRGNPATGPELWKRLGKVYGSVLIGYGTQLQPSDRLTRFLIGPEGQFKSLESLIAKSGKPQTVYRLYPRDFWIVN